MVDGDGVGGDGVFSHDYGESYDGGGDDGGDDGDGDDDPLLQDDGERRRHFERSRVSDHGDAFSICNCIFFYFDTH